MLSDQEKIFGSHHPQPSDRPEYPGQHPSHPGGPDHPGHPDWPERPEHPGHPEHPEHPEHPGHPEHPEHPEKPNPPITIIVNAEDKSLPAGTKQLSYADVVKLAYGSYDSGITIIYTVSYSNGPEQNRKGNLVKGQSVWVQEGMVFNVSRSDKS